MFEFVKKFKLKREKVKQETIAKKLVEVKSYFSVKSTLQGSYDEFMDKFSNSSLIMLIIGKRGSGKTALGMNFVELGRKLNKKSYVMGFKNSNLPGWIKKSDSLEEIPNNSLVLVDESGILYS